PSAVAPSESEPKAPDTIVSPAPAVPSIAPASPVPETNVAEPAPAPATGRPAGWPQISAAAARLAELLAAAGEPSARQTQVKEQEQSKAALTGASQPVATASKAADWPIDDLNDATAERLLDERWMPST